MYSNLNRLVFRHDLKVAWDFGEDCKFNDKSSLLKKIFFFDYMSPFCQSLTEMPPVVHSFMHAEKKQHNNYHMPWSKIT